MNLRQKCIAEMLGTAFLVTTGCGAASFSSPNASIVGTALAFGLAFIGAFYALGHISGGHFNPAVSLGLSAAGRFPRRNLPWYVLAQVMGAILGAGLIVLLTSGKPGLEHAIVSTANGYGDHSPGGYGLIAGLIIETILTFFFVLIVLGATNGRTPLGFAGLVIGFGLIAIHLAGIPITGLSVNPARSTGPALFAGTWALSQLWAFWLAPLAGAFGAGKLYRYLASPLS